MKDSTFSNTLELWLLDRCAEWRPDLRLIAMSPRYLKEQWNDFSTDMSDWTVKGITRSLLTLVERGEIRLFSKTRTSGHAAAKVAREDLAIEQVRALFADLNALHVGAYGYEFTRAGIQRWNEHNHPNWSHYFRGRHFDFNEVEKGELIICGSKAHLEQVLKWSVDYFRADPAIGLQCVRTGVRRPWQATYWHELPEGFFAAFRYQEAPGIPTASTKVAQAVFSKWGRGSQ